MLKRHLLFAILLLFVTPVVAQHTLTVTITDIRSDEGRLLIGLYKGADTWLHDTQVYRTDEVAPKEGEVVISFANLPAGEYGLALLHDEDGDEEMSFTWMGMPAEAYGFSRIDSRMMREPDFEECRIVIDKDRSFTIDLVHW